MKKIMFSILVVLFVSASAISAVKTCKWCQDERNKCKYYCYINNKVGMQRDRCDIECRADFRACITSLTVACK